MRATREGAPWVVQRCVGAAFRRSRPDSLLERLLHVPGADDPVAVVHGPRRPVVEHHPDPVGHAALRPEPRTGPAQVVEQEVRRAGCLARLSYDFRQSRTGTAPRRAPRCQ